MGLKRSMIVKVAASIFSCIFSYSHTQACELDKKAVLPLGYDNGVATVDVKINGRSVTMGVDTGALTFVTPQTSDRLQLVESGRHGRVKSVTATVKTSSVIIRDMEFAGAHFRYKSVVKLALPQIQGLDGKLLSSSLGGLIGTDVLADYDLDFDFPQRKLTLYKTSRCPTVKPLDFKVSASIPFKFNPQRGVLVPVEVDGVKLTAILDTGAARHAILQKAAVQKIGISQSLLKAAPSVEVTGAGDIKRKRPLYAFKTLTLGAETIANPLMWVLDTSLYQGEVLLGQEYLFRRRFWISNASRTLFLEAPSEPQGPYAAFRVLPSRPKANADLKPTNPIQFPPMQPPPKVNADAIANASKQPPIGNGFLGVVLATVSPECTKTLGASTPHIFLVRGFGSISAAQKAGLRLADIIVALNDNPISDVQSFTARIRALGASQKARLKVLRDKQEIVIEAVLDDIAEKTNAEQDENLQILMRIDANKAILAKLSEKECVNDRAFWHVMLGSNYVKSHSNTANKDFPDLAIQSLEDGLSGATPEKRPIVWSEGYISLGSAYRFRVQGDHAQNIEKAIQAYEAALTLDKKVMSRVDQGRALTGLGLALFERGSGPRSDNIEKALEKLKAAQQAFDPKSNAKEWADLQRAMANIYLERVEGAHDQNVMNAIFALKVALTAYDVKLFPKERNDTKAQLEKLEKRAP